MTLDSGRTQKVWYARIDGLTREFDLCQVYVLGGGLKLGCISDFNRFQRFPFNFPLKQT